MHSVYVDTQISEYTLFNMLIGEGVFLFRSVNTSSSPIAESVATASMQVDDNKESLEESLVIIRRACVDWLVF
jgi:hypothetical protein